MPGIVRIAGAGASGLAAAVLLARRGATVELYDRRAGGGGRFHGGWQVIENGTSERDALDELRALGLPDGFTVIPATRALLLDGIGGAHEVASTRPFAYFVRRGAGNSTLDGVLLRRAMELGVRLREREAAPANADVVATGPRQADGVAREIVFITDLPDTVAVLFDPALTPTGYAYLFAVAGHGTFGVAQVRQVRDLRRAGTAAWQRFRDVLGPFSAEVVHEGGQFMNFSLPRFLRAGAGAWHVGEAAGIQDFLFGLGIRLALRSAALAADGIVGSFDHAVFETTVLRPMRTSIALRFIYERSGASSLARACRVASRRDFRELLLRVQRPSLVKDLIARAVMAAWRERSGCRHGPLCAWCRRRET